MSGPLESWPQTKRRQAFERSQRRDRRRVQAAAGLVLANERIGVACIDALLMVERWYRLSAKEVAAVIRMVKIGR